MKPVSYTFLCTYGMKLCSAHTRTTVSQYVYMLFWQIGHYPQDKRFRYVLVFVLAQLFAFLSKYTSLTSMWLF